MRTIWKDLNVAQTGLAGAVRTLTWSAQQIVTRFNRLVLEITGTARSISDVSAVRVFSGGGQVVTLSTLGAILAFANRTKKTLVDGADTLLDLDFDMFDTALSALSELDGVSQLEVDVTNEANDITIRPIFGTTLYPADFRPFQCGIQSVAQNFTGTANERVDVPKYPGVLVALQFVQTNFTRLRARNTEFGEFVNARVSSLRAAAQARNYNNTDFGTDIGVLFDENRDNDGAVSRVELDITADLSGADTNPIHFVTLT